jgi:hypothetical protein
MYQHSMFCSGPAAGVLAERLSAGNAPSCTTDADCWKRPHPERDGAIVLLHDDDMAEVKLHDVIDIIGILDPLMHMDEGDTSDADSFDEILQQENADDEGGEAAPTQGKVRVVLTSCRPFLYLDLDDSFTKEVSHVTRQGWCFPMVLCCVLHRMDSSCQKLACICQKLASHAKCKGQFAGGARHRTHTRHACPPLCEHVRQPVRRHLHQKVAPWQPAAQHAICVHRLACPPSWR